MAIGPLTMNLRVDTGTASTPVTPKRSLAVNHEPAADSQPTTTPTPAATVSGGEDPDIDTQKVAELQAAIAEGRFTIHPERIADAVLASAQEALSGEAL